MIVYVVRGDCPDYYCGCGGGHLLAVAGTEERARELAEQAKGKPRKQRGSDFGYGPFDSSSIGVQGPIETDLLIEEEFIVG